MKIIRTPLPGVSELAVDVYADNRGFFMETYQQEKFKALGIHCRFVQDNLSHSHRGVLRGLHYQYPHPQAKLVQVLAGEIFDVVVDVRRGSGSFGKWAGAILSEEDNRLLYISEGFAHGFCCVSERALVHYKCGELYSPESEGGVLWSDPDLGIDWPLKTPILSEKDSRHPCLRDIPVERLPVFKG